MNILEIYNKNNHFGRLLQMEYEILAPGKVRYSLTVREELLATATAAHGGAIAGFMDGIVGVAALSAVVDEGKVVSTVEFKINFIKGALMGEQLTGMGEVLRKGKSLVIAKGEIFNESGDLVATALATLNAYPVEKSTF